MKTAITVSVIAIFIAGCSSSRSDRNTTRNTESIDQFVTAIETIANSTDVDDVHAADAQLRNGGTDAIAVLRTYLTDTRVPAANYLTRAVSGTPDMSDHAFWLIQDLIETPAPKLFAGQYSVLTPSNVETWLDGRDGKSLLELQIDAARTAYENAKSDHDATGASSASNAMSIYRDRISELENQSQ